MEFSSPIFNLLRRTFFHFDEDIRSSIYSDRPISLDPSQHTASYTQEKSNSSSATPIELSIEFNHYAGKCKASYIEKMNRLLLAIRFTSLCISCNNLSIDLFLQILQLLPNLDTLMVLEFPITQLNDLSDENAKLLRLIPINNKITRVALAGKHELLDFFMALCFRAKHLEFGFVRQEDLEKLVRLTLIKRRIHTPYLYSLCLNVNQANDQTIHKLQNVINLEKLLSNYTIKRSGDHIFLRWNLQ